MRVSLDCRDPELLAAEVRRLRNVIGHDHWDAICQEGERVSREEGYKAMQAEVVALHAECERLRLTDAEREAVALMADIANDPRGVAVHHGCDVAATLRGLLQRLSGNGDCPAADNAAGQDNALRLLAELDEELGLRRTPNPHATPGEGSVPPQRTEDGGK